MPQAVRKEGYVHSFDDFGSELYLALGEPGDSANAEDLVTVPLGYGVNRREIGQKISWLEIKTPTGRKIVREIKNR